MSFIERLKLENEPKSNGQRASYSRDLSYYHTFSKEIGPNRAITEELENLVWVPSSEAGS